MLGHAPCRHCGPENPLLLSHALEDSSRAAMCQRKRSDRLIRVRQLHCERHCIVLDRSSVGGRMLVCSFVRTNGSAVLGHMRTAPGERTLVIKPNRSVNATVGTV